MTTVDFVRRFARTAQTFERRSETSDGLVAIVLWSVGGLALTLLVIWLGSGESSSASADEQTDFVLPKFATLASKNNARPM